VNGGASRLVAALAALTIVAGLVLAVAFMAPEAPGLAPSPEGPGPGDVAARVIRVVDGDTLVVQADGGPERLRYVGIDAPEIARQDGATAAECWADEATMAHAGLVGGAVLRLERDVSDRDRFGRLLRHGWIERDGTWHHVGEELVRLGAAHARSYPPDTRYDGRLGDAEREARRNGLGLWGAC